MKLVVDEFKPLQKNTLRGFCRLLLPEGLILHDVSVHVRDGRAWASPPGKPMLSREGVQMRDAAGKPLFAPVLSFTGKADQAAFSTAVVDALRRTHPEVFVS